MSKILFVLKQRHSYQSNYSVKNSGLLNSAHFVYEMLKQNGVETKLVQVIDNNCIDREVNEYKPDIVIIEALWVVPDKFQILKKLHPNVRWIIRLHSHVPFLANEGVAIDWIKRYDLMDNVFIGSNYKPLISAFKGILTKDIIYLPNYYPDNVCNKVDWYIVGCINIACFGAIRPMKNQLIQAMAAIEFANQKRLKLKFHINGFRVEQNGESNLKNIKALFDNTSHELVMHEWYTHDEFLNTVSKMDIGMQVSLSETYNIVTADFVNRHVPVVVSKEIKFVNPFTKCNDAKDINEIIGSLEFAFKYPKFSSFIDRWLLKNNSNRAKKVWLKFIKK